MATTRRATSSVCNQPLTLSLLCERVYLISMIKASGSTAAHLSSPVFPITVWFKVKLHVKDAKTMLDKKKYVAFWLERYAKKEPGMPLTVIFDMTDSGLGNIVSPPLYCSQNDTCPSLPFFNLLLFLMVLFCAELTWCRQFFFFFPFPLIVI